MLQAAIIRTVDRRGDGGTPPPIKSGLTPLTRPQFLARFLDCFTTEKVVVEQVRVVRGVGHGSRVTPHQAFSGTGDGIACAFP